MSSNYEKLRAEMNRQHIKAFTLAKKADINPSDLYSALNGNRPVFPAWRKRIAAALGAEEEDLFDDNRSEEDHD